MAVKSKISKNRKINSKLINILNINKSYSLLPYKAKEMIAEASWPKLSIDISESLNFPDIENISNEIKHSLSSCFIKINEQDIELLESSNILAIDSVIFSLKAALKNRSIVREKEKILAKSINNFYESVGQKSYEAAKKVWKDSGIIFSNVVWSAINKYYRFDKEALYFSYTKSKNLSYKKNHCISIKTFQPESRLFNLKNSTRESYLCWGFDNNGSYELIMPKDFMGNFKPLKIYIQKHAITRIMERLSLNTYGDVFYAVSDSLSRPFIACKNFDCYFIDFYYNKHKLGYLLASLEEDAVLIRTFKFITMMGTPEYFKLKKELGGVREDFEYLGMDSLEIINSDVFSDPKLVKIFQKCGLGHLFEVKKNVVFETPQNLIAGEIKKYFRIEV